MDLSSFWTQNSGMLLQGTLIGPSIAGAVAALLVLGYFGLPFFLWSAAIAAALFGFGAPLGLFMALVCIDLVFLIRPLRKATVSAAVMKTMKALKLIPPI